MRKTNEGTPVYVLCTKTVRMIDSPKVVAFREGTVYRGVRYSRDIQIQQTEQGKNQCHWIGGKSSDFFREHFRQVKLKFSFTVEVK